MNPVACPIIVDNFQAIISEGIYQIKRESSLNYLIEWLKENERGYYLRDEGAPWDCHLIRTDVFDELYLLGQPQLNIVFIPVTRKN